MKQFTIELRVDTDEVTEKFVQQHVLEQARALDAAVKALGASIKRTEMAVFSDHFYEGHKDLS